LPSLKNCGRTMLLAAAGQVALTQRVRGSSDTGGNDDDDVAASAW